MRRLRIELVVPVAVVAIIGLLAAGFQPWFPDAEGFRAVLLGAAFLVVPGLAVYLSDPPRPGLAGGAIGLAGFVCAFAIYVALEGIPFCGDDGVCGDGELYGYIGFILYGPLMVGFPSGIGYISGNIGHRVRAQRELDEAALAEQTGALRSRQGR